MSMSMQGGGAGGSTPTKLYNATTNTPDLTTAPPTADITYYVSAAGTQDFGANGGVIALDVGDLLQYVLLNTTWIKRDQTPKASETANDSAVTGATVKDALETNKGLIDANTAKTSIITNATTTTGTQLNLVEGTDNGTNKVAFAAPAALASDRTITVPDSDVDLGDIATNNLKPTQAEATALAIKYSIALG